MDKFSQFKFIMQSLGGFNRRKFIYGYQERTHIDSKYSKVTDLMNHEWCFDVTRNWKVFHILDRKIETEFN